MTSTTRLVLVAAIAMQLAAGGAPVVASDDHHPEEHDEHGDAGAKHAFTVAEMERFGVRVAEVGAGAVDLGVELPGEVRPNGDRIAHIAPRFAGIARHVRKYVGDRVRAGDVLAVIESENLATYEVKAALDGTVIDKHIAPGEAVTREQAVFIIADLSTVWVNVNVYQSALPEIHPGRPVTITTSHGALEASGTVDYVSPVVDQATRTATARVVLPNPDGAWRPGLFVSATVFNPVQAAVVVPRAAIQTMDGSPVVFAIEDDHFEARRVTLGRTGRSRAEVTSGLRVGDRIAVERSFLVKAELGKAEAGGHAH